MPFAAQSCVDGLAGAVVDLVHRTRMLDNGWPKIQQRRMARHVVQLALADDLLVLKTGIGQQQVSKQFLAASG